MPFSAFNEPCISPFPQELVDDEPVGTSAQKDIAQTSSTKRFFASESDKRSGDFLLFDVSIIWLLKINLRSIFNWSNEMGLCFKIVSEHLKHLVILLEHRLRHFCHSWNHCQPYASCDWNLRTEGV